MVEHNVSMAVYGLGHVGLVTAICLAGRGHKVTGIEIVQSKVDSLNAGKLYIEEPGLKEIWQEVESEIDITNDYKKAVSARVHIICVGTPSMSSDHVNLDYVKGTSLQIAELLGLGEDRKTILIRSTIPPTTTRRILIPLIESASGKKNFKDFDLYYFPEFLREGAAVEDFLNPPLQVMGVDDENKTISERMNFLLHSKDPTLVGYEEAEMIKYMNNSWHALKVTFANEIATLASAMDVRVDKLFSLFKSDEKLNISDKYLTPGFSYGGPCLTKELRAITTFAKDIKMDTPLLESVGPSNNKHTQRYLSVITDKSYEKILICGLSFKRETDDIRESPLISILNEVNNLPSYITKEVCIYERESVFKKLKERNIIQIYSASDPILSEIDLCIIGTYFDDEILNSLNKNTHLLNLGFYSSEKFNNFKNINVI